VFVNPANERYIQWLFPIREQGLNSQAYPLQPHEIKIISSSAEMQTRLRTSLRLMLDFYGMTLSKPPSLLVTRHSDPVVRRRQYRNLNLSYHNYLRITRIFKSLTELGQQDYVGSILLFILSEQSEWECLDGRDLRGSMDRYWVYCMRNREMQATVANAIKWVREAGGVFTEGMYRRVVERREKDGVWRFEPLVDGVEEEDGEDESRHIIGIPGHTYGSE